MSSTHTTCPKIKTGNPSPKIHPTLHPQQKNSHSHTIIQIEPNHHTIHQNNQNEFDTEFDQTLVYQRKINFLTILNHQFSPKIITSKSRNPCKI